MVQAQIEVLLTKPIKITKLTTKQTAHTRYLYLYSPNIMQQITAQISRQTKAELLLPSRTDHPDLKILLENLSKDQAKFFKIIWNTTQKIDPTQDGIEIG